MNWKDKELCYINDGSGFPTGCQLEIGRKKGIAMVLFTSKEALKGYAWHFMNPNSIDIRILHRKTILDRGVQQVELIKMCMLMKSKPSGPLPILGAVIDPKVSDIGFFVSIEDLITGGRHQTLISRTEKDDALDELVGD